MTQVQLVTAGETMALLSSDKFGLLRHAPSLELSVAGAESNVAIGAARLGVPTAWIGRVGDDEFGARILRELRGEGIDVRARITDAGPTGLMVKQRRTAESASVWYYRTASAGSYLAVDDMDAELIGQAEVLHVTGITCGLSGSAHAAVRFAVDVAVSAGTAVSIDLNYRRALWKDADFGAVLRPLVGVADLVFASPDEAVLLTGRQPSPEHLVRALAALGPRQAVLKMGADGAIALVDGQLHYLAAHPIDVVDSVGAGDAFVAGWLTEHLANAPVAERMRTAMGCGAYACTVSGDWEAAPTRADLARFHTEGADPVLR